MPSSRPASARRSSNWPEADAQLLMQLHARGLKWQEIAQYFPNKTTTACRKAHKRRMDREDFNGWDDERRERLGQKYTEVREQMWSILGNAIGEKFDVVESKCMDYGVKSLKNFSIQAKKRDSLTVQQPRRVAGSDSGISMGESGSPLSDSREADRAYQLMMPSHATLQRRMPTKPSYRGPTIPSMLH